jgi:hypothetical protein
MKRRITVYNHHSAKGQVRRNAFADDIAPSRYPEPKHQIEMDGTAFDRFLSFSQKVGTRVEAPADAE